MQDGYAVDQHGVHHRVLNAVLETKPGKDCYGWVDVYPTRLELVGIGELESQTMPFGEKQKPSNCPEPQKPDPQTAEKAALDRQPV